MPLPLIDAALRGMVLALALLLLAVLLRQRRQVDTPAATAALLLCLGLAVQVLGSAPWAERNLGCAAQSPLIAVAVGNAVLFWMFSAALFDDGFRWRPWHAATPAACRWIRRCGSPRTTSSCPSARLVPG